MLNIVLCDDDIEFCNKVTRQLKKKFQAIEIKEFYKYDKSFKEYIEKNKISTIFILDIDLNSKNADGYAIAKKIRKIRNYNDEIIFLINDTSMSPAIVKHKIQPVDFITKSDYGSNELTAAINRGYNEIISRKEDTDTGMLLVTYKYRYCKLLYKNIIYIKLQDDSRSVLIKMRPTYMEGEMAVVSSISSVMKKLDDRFMQISRTAIVNKDFVVDANAADKKVILKFDHVLEGSEDKIKELLKCMKP